VSALPDYMRFALMLWNGGEYRGARVLERETLDNMLQLHVPEGVLLREGIEGLGWGLGWSIVADAEASVMLITTATSGGPVSTVQPSLSARTRV